MIYFLCMTNVKDLTEPRLILRYINKFNPNTAKLSYSNQHRYYSFHSLYAYSNKNLARSALFFTLNENLLKSTEVHNEH